MLLTLVPVDKESIFYKVKKGKKLLPSDYKLHFNGRPVSSKTVSAEVMLNTLAKGCEKGVEIYKKKNAQESGKIAPTEKGYFIKDESEILSEFYLTKNSFGQVQVKDYSLKIKDAYLPDDDNAPDRVSDIVNEYIFLHNRMLDDQRKIMNKNRNFKSSFTQYWGSEFDWTTEEFSLNALTRNDNGTYDEVPETRKSLNREKVKETLFIWQVQLNKSESEQLQAAAAHRVEATEGYLEGLKLKISEEGGIVPDNLNESNHEIQTIIGEIRNYFELTS